MVAEWDGKRGRHKMPGTTPPIQAQLSQRSCRPSPSPLFGSCILVFLVRFFGAGFWLPGRSGGGSASSYVSVELRCLSFGGVSQPPLGVEASICSSKPPRPSLSPQTLRGYLLLQLLDNLCSKRSSRPGGDGDACLQTRYFLLTRQGEGGREENSSQPAPGVFYAKKPMPFHLTGLRTDILCVRKVPGSWRSARSPNPAVTRAGYRVLFDDMSSVRGSCINP